MCTTRSNPSTCHRACDFRDGFASPRDLLFPRGSGGVDFSSSASARARPPTTMRPVVRNTRKDFIGILPFLMLRLVERKRVRPLPNAVAVPRRFLEQFDRRHPLAPQAEHRGPKLDDVKCLSPRHSPFFAITALVDRVDVATERAH